MTFPAPVPFLSLPFLARDIELRSDGDGTLRLRSRVPLGPVERHLPLLLRRQAAQRPDRPWLKARQAAGGWSTLTYGDAARQVDAAAQWLVSLGRPGRSVMVLSGNSPEHAVIEMAAMQARMPYVPVTPAYSLLSRDFAKLRAMVELVDPAVVFVQSLPAFARALTALPGAPRLIVSADLAGSGPAEGPAAVPWAELLQTAVQPTLQASVDAIEPATIAKILFTSGSTGVPKAVPVTQHMLCATTAMHAMTVGFDAEAPESVLLEWLPWSHVAGGTAVFNSVLADGGTMHLDDGRPVPGEFERTLRNLEEVSPTRFSSVPAGYAMLADALERSESLGRGFFRRLRRLTSSGARLPDSIYRRLQQQAVRHLGRRVPFVAGYGSTETCAATTVVHWPTDRTGLVGLPQPGVELKLVPLDAQRYEVRVRGPSVMAGYLHRPDLALEAFDAEGYYRMGDAVAFVDPARPEEGLAFAGRVAEEFKLQSGIFVRVGSLRVEVVSATAPLVSDVVVTGADQPYVGVLAWPNPAACRERFGPLAPDALARHPGLHAELRSALSRHNALHDASSLRVQRALVLAEPPSMDAGEITDKGYINQRAVLERRAADVEALYADPPAAHVVALDR